MLYTLYTFVSERAVKAKTTLRQARIGKLMSANELGRAAGVAASTVLKIEEGAVPRLATIRKLASALGVDAVEIAWPGDPLGLGDVTSPKGEPS